jgi:hypothetical protein
VQPGVDGYSWSEKVHSGPWGYCFTGPQVNCFASQARSFRNGLGTASAGGSHAAAYVTGMAAATTSRVRVTLSGGKSETVRVVDAGGPRFYAFAIPKGATLVSVAVLAASGHG